MASPLNKAFVVPAITFSQSALDELADTIRRAFKIAQSGRPGPVLVDITKDVTANVADYEPKAPELGLPDTEDKDVEIIISNLMSIGRYQSMKMFDYGVLFTERENEQ